MGLREIRDSEHRDLFVTDFDRTLEPAMSTLRHAATVGSDGVVQLERQSEVLSVFEGVQAGNIKQLPRGCHEAVLRAAQLRGEAVTGYVSRLVKLDELSAVPGSPPQGLLESFVLNREGGILRIGTGVSRAKIIAQIVHAYPRARIVVLAARERDVRRLRVQLRALLPPGNNAGEFQTRRPVVSKLLASIDAEIKQADIVIVPWAQDACAEHARYATMAASRGRQFAMLGIDEQMARRDWDWVRAVFGPSYLSVRQIGQPTRLVRTAIRRIAGGYKIPHDADLLALQRQGIWQHAVRNRQICRLVKSLRQDQDKARRVVVLAANPEHAVALARLLPEARLQFAREFTACELRSRDRAIVAQRQRGNGFVPNVLIATCAAVEEVHFESFDVVVRVDANPGLPPDPERFSLAQDNSSRSLLMFDFQDNHHPVLRQRSRMRQQAYAEEGWWPINESLNLAPIDHFLNSRP